MNPSAEPGHVYLVGAGPGDPNLITLRAARLLATADVVLPDDLVSDAVLDLASPTAEIIPVGKRCGQPRITQAGIHELMLHHARAGQSVVRLKSGDPLVFGRAGEEMAALREAGVPFEIVSGITTAFAVAASLQTPLTDRTAASKLILATAHHAEGKLSLTPSWHGAFPPEATLVLYMPGRNFAALSADLIAAGIPGESPCVAVSKATTPDEQVCATTVAGLPEASVGPAPLLLLIGHAIQPGR
ncbi:uroporphyrinogen-III C-methyltransferase [Granulicella rosea]|uniref:uroporphyrinogen-III C-methyltransferase n=1 Tax=Granulicella rosea TaxID=474952 RepID=A0A239HQ02_9BACT|nr:uroporphyrinogen-III C-methyltransferase [Granulicella rosea]SNS83291.1 uroporphyrinogen-III C-methyltransferase [Granulicella rosea]